MESSSSYIPRKRVFSSSLYDVIDIDPDPPSPHRSSNSKAKGKQKEVAFHEIIDLDIDEDGNDVVFIGGKNADSNKKMKGIMRISTGPSSASKLDAEKAVSNNKGKEFIDSSKSFNPKSANFFDLGDYVSDDVDDLTLQSYIDNIDLPTGIKDPAYTLTGKRNHFSNNNNTQVAVNSHGPSSSRSAGSSSSKAKPVANDDAMKKYQSFKRFDTVMDHSDHHFATTQFQQSKSCAKRIQKEWTILEKDLPETIYVRVYESRMDLLRAVIIGAEGTPYHDGLFFFDVCFPSSYPNQPPLVHYHSGGVRINPNLYDCGKVCLSLLNTWAGDKNERWVPGKSTMLQVLVSIQGLILNAKPYYNEPGFESFRQLEGPSFLYNESTLILSLKTMVYTMNKPPKHFEDLVVGHFRSRVLDILMACKAYIEGVQVGCVVKGGAQDVDEGGSFCSHVFKNGLASYVKTLITAFKKIGAKEAEEFDHLSVKKSPLPAATRAPSAIRHSRTYTSKHW